MKNENKDNNEDNILEQAKEVLVALYGIMWLISFVAIALVVLGEWVIGMPVYSPLLQAMRVVFIISGGLSLTGIYIERQEGYNET